MLDSHFAIGGTALVAGVVELVLVVVIRSAAGVAAIGLSAAIAWASISLRRETPSRAVVWTAVATPFNVQASCYALYAELEPLLSISAARSVVLAVVATEELVRDSSSPATAALLWVSTALSLTSATLPMVVRPAPRQGGVREPLTAWLHVAWACTSTGALIGTLSHLGRWLGLCSLFLISLAQLTARQPFADAALLHAAWGLLSLGLVLGLVLGQTSAAVLVALTVLALVSLGRAAAAAVAAVVAAAAMAPQAGGGVLRGRRALRVVALTLLGLPVAVLTAAFDVPPSAAASAADRLWYPVARRAVLTAQAAAATAATAAMDAARGGALGGALGALLVLDAAASLWLALPSRRSSASRPPVEPAERPVSPAQLEVRGRGGPPPSPRAPPPAAAAAGVVLAPPLSMRAFTHPPPRPKPAAAPCPKPPSAAPRVWRALRACGKCCCCAGPAYAAARRRCACGCASCYALAALALLAGAAATHDPAGAAWMARHAPFYGVNLGGWLLTERWLNDYDGYQLTIDGTTLESPYNGSSWTDVWDEHSLSLQLHARGEAARLVAFRQRFVTRDDFVELRARGVAAVRLPFGYWMVREPVPGESYVHGAGLARLDDAVRWAEELGVKVLLDLHGAPGSQNGKQTSGLEYEGWAAERFDAAAAVDVIGLVARRYHASAAVIGVELLNEPELPAAVLVDYYQRAYAAVRRGGMRAEDVAVVINLFRMQHILTEGWAAFNWRLPPASYPNLVYDLHLYYAFLPDPIASLGLTFVTHACVDLGSMALELTGRPAFVGEWSLALPWWGTVRRELDAMTAAEEDAMRRAFFRRQSAVITRGRRAGGFYWTWNARAGEWGFSDLEARGWMERHWWSEEARADRRD